MIRPVRPQLQPLGMVPTCCRAERARLPSWSQGKVGLGYGPWPPSRRHCRVDRRVSGIAAQNAGALGSSCHHETSWASVSPSVKRGHQVSHGWHTVGVQISDPFCLGQYHEGPASRATCQPALGAWSQIPLPFWSSARPSPRALRAEPTEPTAGSSCPLSRPPSI